MADVVDHPLGDQELGQLGQAPGRKGQVVVLRAGQGDLLISLRSGNVNVGGRPLAYFGARESNPSSLKLWITALTRSSEVKVIVASGAHPSPGRTKAPSGLFVIAPPIPNHV